MKTSNKLLLGIFLTIIILTSIVQLTVYAKYKRGEFTSFKREDLVPMNSLAVPAVRFISLKGLGSCAIKPSETLKLEIQKDRADIIKYHVLNDTLYIDNPKVSGDQLERGSRTNGLVNIYLPASVQLNAAYSVFRVWGADDSTSAPSYNISLGKDCRLFINFSGTKTASVYFNQLNINELKSTIDLDRHVVINDLKMQLSDSKLNDNQATIRKLTVDTDDNSTINLSGKNVKAIK